MRLPNTPTVATLVGAALVAAAIAALYALSFAVMPLVALTGLPVPHRMAAGTPGGVFTTAFFLLVGFLVVMALRGIGWIALSKLEVAPANTAD
jgi:hypothetical protein